VKAKLVAHHDDPPCKTRLKNGFCPECKYVPDMQSTALWYYCPNCDLPLEKLKCLGCKAAFEKP
jgi:hypothetical protein